MLFAVVTVVSCIDTDNDELSMGAITGGIIELDQKSKSIGYVVGNDGTYTVASELPQGAVKTNKVDVYKQLSYQIILKDADNKDSLITKKTNKVLFNTFNFENPVSGIVDNFTFSFKYEDLIDALVKEDGTSLPANDGELLIGDFWKLTYVTTTSEGDVLENSAATKISLGTRYAGTYKPLDGAYYRIGVLTYELPDWLLYCPETLIESVDATTYRVVEYFGPFGSNTWYFQIGSDGTITYPENTPDGTAQLGNGQPFITCQTNPGDMSDVPCDPSLTNKVIRDDVNGADQLFMSFGYFTSGSGARSFYHVLEKIVE